MAGSKFLRQIQLGREAVAGTPVAATSLWPGLGMLSDDREIVFPEQALGYLSGTDRSYVPKLAASIALEPVPATFEQYPHLLEAGVKLVGNGVADGVGSGKIYTYPYPTTAKNTIKPYSVRGGDDEAVEIMEYGFAQEITLEGKAGEAWMMSGTLVGRQVQPGAFTPGLVPASVEEILFSLTKLYIDDVDGVIGTTLVSNTLLSARASIKTGWFARFTADGQLYFSYAKFDPTLMEILLEITFEHDATSIAEKANWRAQKPRQLRLLNEGSALAAAGTTYSKKTAIFDLAGKWERFEKVGEDAGNDIITSRFRSRYNATADLFAQHLLVNELAAIP